MGTRCGSIDPAIVPYMMDRAGMTAKEMDAYMNKKSGMLGISGESSDFRDLGEGAKNGDERCKLALEMFALAVKKFIGSYSAEMNGVDAIVFTAGVGENDPQLRNDVVEALAFLGLAIDPAKNTPRSKEPRIVSPDGHEGPLVMVVPTNEELAIARQTLATIG